MFVRWPLVYDFAGITDPVKLQELPGSNIRCVLVNKLPGGTHREVVLVNRKISRKRCHD